MLIDQNILSTALDAWELDTSSYDSTPFHGFSLAQPTESSYLWQLSRGAVPPDELVDKALLNLVAWGLIDERGGITTLGARLLSSRANAAPSERLRLTAIGAASRLSDRALHLVREIAAGRNRIFAADERPPGWVHLERLGLAARERSDRVRLTGAGQEFARGLDDGQREALEQGWTKAHAKTHLAEVGAPRSLFDAGRQVGIRAATGFDRASRRYAHTAPRAAARGRLRLTTARVIADLKKATGIPASIRTKRTRRSGITVRERNNRLIFVEYDDFGDRGDQPAVWPKIIAALEKAGYTLHMADGSSGTEAKSKALENGAVLVAREAT